MRTALVAAVAMLQAAGWWVLLPKTGLGTGHLPDLLAFRKGQLLAVVVRASPPPPRQARELARLQTAGALVVLASPRGLLGVLRGFCAENSDGVATAVAESGEGPGAGPGPRAD